MGERFFIWLDDETTKTECLDLKSKVEKALHTDVLVNDDYTALAFTCYMDSTANHWRLALDDIDWPDNLYFTIVYPDGSTAEHSPD